MLDQDQTQELRERVSQAAANRQKLRIVGGDTKAFLTPGREAEPLNMAGHSGIVSYEPSELVLTARAGTPLADIEQLLTDHGQMLPFEPPYFGDRIPTLGGAIAAGLGGPRRPWGGAPRDLVLGVKLLDGLGQVLSFGGQVMKNVAGYDIARLLAGSWGSLGVLLEVSVKVLPKPETEVALRLKQDRDTALKTMRELARRPAPLSGACHLGEDLHLRLSGNSAGIKEWRARIGGEEEDLDFWLKLRDHRLGFFHTDQPIWRLSLPPATRQLACEEHVLTDWAGAQRWVRTKRSAKAIQAEVTQADGHARAFHNLPQARLPAASDALVSGFEARLRERFDPQALFHG